MELNKIVTAKLIPLIDLLEIRKFVEVV